MAMIDILRLTQTKRRGHDKPKERKGKEQHGKNGHMEWTTIERSPLSCLALGWWAERVLFCAGVAQPHEYRISPNNKKKGGARERETRQENAVHTAALCISQDMQLGLLGQGRVIDKYTLVLTLSNAPRRVILPTVPSSLCGRGNSPL